MFASFRYFSLFSVLIITDIGRRVARATPLLQLPAHGQNLTIEPAHCTDSPDWAEGVNGKTRKADCNDAVNIFFLVDVQIYGHEKFEFLAPATLPRYSLPAFLTPMKIKARTCTMVIASLSVFPVGSLPDGGERVFPTSDVASYSDLMHSAKSVRLRCMILEKKAGWAGEGREDAVGVFLWATGSKQDVDFGVKVPGARVLDVENLPFNVSKADDAAAAQRKVERQPG